MLNRFWNTLNNKYLIEICYLEKQSPDDIPVGKDHQYLIVNDASTVTDFTTNPHLATVFGFVLGVIITKGLNKSIKTDCPNLMASMVSVSDVNFINEVTQGQ